MGCKVFIDYTAKLVEGAGNFWLQSHLFGSSHGLFVGHNASPRMWCLTIFKYFCGFIHFASRPCANFCLKCSSTQLIKQ